jgi:peptidoglycan/LPS O-acetylase OafA/YrhL
MWLGGTKGVTIFFILSGYLITLLALREEDQRGKLDLLAFYIRRTFRIFPPYYLTVAVYAFLLLVLKIRQDKVPNFLAALPYDLSYFQEIPFILGVRGEHENIPFYHSWSLGIEEKFYLVWPFLTFVLLRSRKAWRPLITLILAALFATSGSWAGRAVGGCIFWYLHILVGCGVALLLHYPEGYRRLSRFGKSWYITATGVLFLTIHFAWPHYARFPYIEWIDVVYSIVAGAFLLSILTNRGWLGRLLSWPPLQFIGRISYGIYLVHVLCLNFVEAVLKRIFPHLSGLTASLMNLSSAVAISIAVAYLLHIAVERPFIEVGRRWSKRLLNRRPARGSNASSGAL